MARICLGQAPRVPQRQEIWPTPNPTNEKSDFIVLKQTYANQPMT